MPELWCVQTTLLTSIAVQHHMRCILETKNASSWKTWEPRRKVKARGWPHFVVPDGEALIIKGL